MSDDEESTQVAEVGDITFVPDDHTTAVAGPKWIALITPGFASHSDEHAQQLAKGIQFFDLPHPRTGDRCVYAVCPTKANELTLCQLEQHRPSFSCLFVGNRVEPDGAIQLLTPIDLAFHGIWLLLQQHTSRAAPAASDISKWATDGFSSSEYPFKYKSVEDMIATEPRLAPIADFGFAPALTAALRRVADCQEISSDDIYFRFNAAKVVSFAKARFDAVMENPLSLRVVYPERRVEPRLSTGPAVQTLRSRRSNAGSGVGGSEDPSAVDATPVREPAAAAELSPPGTTPGGASPVPHVAGPSDEFFKLRCLHMVLEFIPKSLHAAIGHACGMELDTAEGSVRARANQQAASSASLLERDYSGPAADDSAKKHRSEGPAKSASVKKLEKAGPPKGTPSLASMFAKVSAKKPDEQ